MSYHHIREHIFLFLKFFTHFQRRVRIHGVERLMNMKECGLLGLFSELKTPEFG